MIEPFEKTTTPLVFKALTRKLNYRLIFIMGFEPQRTPLHPLIAEYGGYLARQIIAGKKRSL